MALLVGFALSEAWRAPSAVMARSEEKTKCSAVEYNSLGCSAIEWSHWNAVHWRTRVQGSAVGGVEGASCRDGQACGEWSSAVRWSAFV